MDRLVAGNCAPSVPKRTNVCCLEPRSQSALNFRGVTLDPPPDGDVVGVQALLGQQLFFNAPLRLPDSDGLDGVFSLMALVTITNIAAQLAFGRRKR
jgi:hypothetical protein